MFLLSLIRSAVLLKETICCKQMELHSLKRNKTKQIQQHQKKKNKKHHHHHQQKTNPGLNMEKKQKGKEYKTPKAMAGKTFNLE